MIEILPAYSGDALEDVIALAQDYVRWMTGEIRVQYPALDIREFTSEHAYDDLRAKFPGAHAPPDGCLLLARLDGAACGCIALARLDAATAEVRTLFVRPTCRGTGVGRALAGAALDEARRLGYGRARLDTLGFMESALALYRSLGFREIAPYLDLSLSLAQYIHFLECDLTR